MDPWLLLPLETGEADALVARGTALLDDLVPGAPPMLRWYRAERPAVVVGRGQRGAVTATDLPVVVRPSGGGAVLMDADLLCVDVLLPAGHRWLGGTPADTYDPVGAAWASALAELGVPGLSVHERDLAASRRGGPRARLLAAVCYATLGRGEVTAGGRKLVGLAQRRRRGGVLVQCGLLRRWRPAPLLAALGADPDDRQVADAAVGLDDLMTPPPSDEAVMDAVGCSLRAHA